MFAVSFFSISIYGQIPRLFTSIQHDTLVYTHATMFTQSFKGTANINALLSTGNSQFIVDLPGNDTVRIVRKDLEVIGNKRLTWYGTIQNEPGSLVILSVNDNYLEGRIIRRNGTTYIIRYSDSQKHQVGLLRSGFAQPLDDDQRLIPPGPPPPPQPICGDPPNIVNVMVLYTAAALQGITATLLQTKVDMHMASTNMSFRASNIDLRFNLVRFEQITYNETGDKTQDLNNLVTGTAAGVHSLRDTYKADFVLLIVNTLNDCGFADVNSVLTVDNHPRGYCIVKRSCLESDYVFTHELGHLAYARHDWSQDMTNMAPFSFNHGGFITYTGSDNFPYSYRTIMSYPNCASGACIQVLHWSNPDVNYPSAMPQSIPTGSATENNARTLELTKSIVSAYRCSTPMAEKVWMRDTNNDTGMEPDPNTATEAMYMSPYIWVRNSRDDGSITPAFPNQQSHQNPVRNSQNWIYVKMHNNGPPISGHLLVYYANASTRLEWPVDWLLIKDTAITLTVNSTEIVEIQWQTPNITGHYCMVARWVSADDPMGFAETPDINHNTRRSNNIIWRNMNIVDLQNVMMMESSFLVQHENKNRPITLIFSDAARFPKSAFIESGKIYLIPDAIFIKSWITGGKKLKGLKFDGEKFLIEANDAKLMNIKLPFKYKASIKIVFEKTESTIRDRFEFRVDHWEKNPTKLIRKGGLGYEIYTTKRTIYK